MTTAGERQLGPGDAAWWMRPPALLVLLVAIVLTGGTAGYVLVEGWPVWDAVYMTVITVTTVGYREVHPLSRAGEVFTVALLTVGVGTVFYAATIFAARVVEGGLRHRWEGRRRERMLDNISEHFILCGYGRIGRIIADEFRRQRVPFVVVDRDVVHIQEVLDAGDLAVAADASAEDVLKRVGIERARGLIAAVGTDAENVYTVLTARLLRPDLYIIARAETDDASRKLRRAGADRVLSPYLIGGTQIAMTALRPAVVDFVHLATSSTHLELAMEQVKIAPGAPLAGQTIVSANLRQRFGVVVVAIQRASGRMDFNPAPDAEMSPGDQLVVLGPPDRVKMLESAAQAQGAGAR